MPDVLFTGSVHANTLTATRFTPPANCINNSSIVAAAGITSDKLQHRHQPVYAASGLVDSVTDRRAVHVVYGATGTLLAVKAGSKTVCTGDATISVDLLVNGVSVLSSAVVLDSANTALVVEAGTLASTALVVGDVVEVSVTAAAGTGTLGDGCFVSVVLDEDAQ